MSFSESIRTCFNKYIDFDGRASRSEYWWFFLLAVGLSFIPVIGWILRLVILLPSLAVQARRLHDMNRSAWWLLLLVPPITFIGFIVLLIMSAFPGTPGPNRYGPDPLRPQYGPGGFDYTPPGDQYVYTPYDADFTVPTYDDEPRNPEDPASGETRRYCTRCGTQLERDARFCTYCGTSL